MIRRNPLRFATLSATVLLLAGAAPAWAADAAGSGPAPATFTLSAEGEVAVAPDIANLQMGVTAQGKTAAEAMKLNRERMSAAVAALKAAGVKTDLVIFPGSDHSWICPTPEQTRAVSRSALQQSVDFIEATIGDKAK